MFTSTDKSIFVQSNEEAILATQSTRMSYAGKHFAEPVYDQRGMGTHYQLFPSLAEAQEYAGGEIKEQYLDFSRSAVTKMERLRYVDLGNQRTVIPWREGERI